MTSAITVIAKYKLSGKLLDGCTHDLLLNIISLILLYEDVTRGFISHFDMELLGEELWFVIGPFYHGYLAIKDNNVSVYKYEDILDRRINALCEKLFL